MSNDDTSTAIRQLSALVEEVISQNDRVLEAVDQIKNDVQNSATSEELQELKADVSTIKAAVTDTNSQVQDIEQRLSALETA